MAGQYNIRQAWVIKLDFIKPVTLVSESPVTCFQIKKWRAILPQHVCHSSKMRVCRKNATLHSEETSSNRQAKLPQLTVFEEKFYKELSKLGDVKNWNAINRCF